jgi:hypothetical protein
LLCSPARGQCYNLKYIYAKQIGYKVGNFDSNNSHLYKKGSKRRFNNNASIFAKMAKIDKNNGGSLGGKTS